MKKWILILVIALVVYFSWKGTSPGDVTQDHASGETVIQQEQSVAENAEATPRQEEPGKSDSLLSTGLRKLSIVGTWEAKYVEVEGAKMELPSSPCTFRFELGGEGTCTAGDDKADIAWTEQDGIVDVVILSGVNVPISLDYVDGVLQWDTDENIIIFEK